MKESTKKADELIDKYFSEMQFSEFVNDLDASKQCAIICVDEIILTLNKDIRDLDVVGNVLLDLIAFWQEVRQEIANLEKEIK